MADHEEASVTLPTDPRSVRAARRYAETVLTQWGIPRCAQTSETVQLIVSELTTNVVRHTHGHSPTFTLRLGLDHEARLRVGVTDSCPRWPRRLPAAVQQDNGRGLMIIRTLAAQAGGRMSVAPAPDGGKTVWIALPRAGAATAVSSVV